MTHDTTLRNTLTPKIQRHGFESLAGHSPLELAMHLGHYLNGTDDDRCWGAVPMTTPTDSSGAQRRAAARDLYRASLAEGMELSARDLAERFERSPR